MNNEIQRKITSLTLMTIMLAGGMFAVVPAMVPAAHAANANLFVSAEHSQFNNYMTGPQVIEVVVIDSDIHDTNQAKGEPDVTINGASLRMAQATDGNWYGYFADVDQAQLADQYTVGKTPGYGLDFGQFCGATSTKFSEIGSTLFSETRGVAIPVRTNGTSYGTNGTSTIVSCTTAFNNDNSGSEIRANATGGVEGRVADVVREAKDLNTNTATGTGRGQLGLISGLWPFVQLYDLTPGGNVVIQYSKGGGAQSTTLTFDTSDQLASYSTDRDVYPLSAQVHVTMNDIRLNVDPTDEDSWTFDTKDDGTNGYQTYYGLFDENGAVKGDTATFPPVGLNSTDVLALMFDDVQLQMNANKQSAANNVLVIVDNADNIVSPATIAAGATAAAASTTRVVAGQQPVTITEQGVNTGIFGTYDDNDKSTLIIAPDALRGTSASLKYNDHSTTILAGNNFATIDIQPTETEWASGQKIPIVLVDQDTNKNSRADEDLAVSNPDTQLIPSISTGDPFTLGEGTNDTKALYGTFVVNHNTSVVGQTNAVRSIVNVTSFSQIGRIDNANATTITANALLIDYQTTFGELRKSISDSGVGGTLKGINMFNYDVRSFNATGTYSIYVLNATGDIIKGTGTQRLAVSTVGSLKLGDGFAPQGAINLNATAGNNTALFSTSKAADSKNVGILFVHQSDTTNVVVGSDNIDPVVADFFSFGFTNDGLEDDQRIANQIVRLELEETGDNTATFAGKIQYLMVNQLTILKASTYTALATDFINDEGKMIVMDDRTNEDAIRVNYLDLGADGVSTQIADQQDAPTHSGVVSLDQSSYKVADTVTVTLEDKDLNVDSSLVDIYTVATSGVNKDLVGIYYNDSRAKLSDNSDLGRLLDITFDDGNWITPTDATCLADLQTHVSDTGLGATGFTLVETAKASGVFVGTFQVPSYWCSTSGTSTATSATTVTGLDLAVDYVDFRDASGQTIEVGDTAGVRANTGSVSLDRTVYPVPFGIPSNFATNTKTTPDARSVFPIHQTGMDTTSGLNSGEFIANGDLIIHVRVNDPDFDVSAAGEDKISQNTTSSNPVGPVKISVIRGSSSMVLGYAGGPTKLDGKIAVGSGTSLINSTRQFGPMTEIAPDAGIFEQDVTVKYTDGPEDTKCPATTVFTQLDGSTSTGETNRFSTAHSSGKNYCIIQGDILQVEYTDPADAGGAVNTVTDSATFDLRNGVLQSDKSVYIIGSDMILTLIEPDFDLDNQSAETYTMDLIEWDSDAATVTMGTKGANQAKFDPEPLNFRETGDSTGIFQVVAEMPSVLGTSNDKLERGEEIKLEYSDWGPSGSDFVGDESEDVKLTIFTSNFGATVALDQKVYTWTDKVYITIVAPDHNFDSNLIDDIGNTADDPIKVATRGAKLSDYKLVETGIDTGIFTGEVILTGFTHDADGKPTTGDSNGNDVVSSAVSGSGPTSGKLPATDNDGLTVSFEFSKDETVVGSALIRWNIGEVQWLEASYPAKGTGVVRVIDPDMNLNPESVDNFNVNTWSDSDAGGIDLTVTETNGATGIFEGTVFFTTTDQSSGHRLRVAEGDTVTAEYEDNTLPAPYTTADELRITATTLIGTVVPPLERAPAANLRIVDAFGNSLSTVNVDQQVQITADLANGQDKKQVFAYLVQIQDGNGVTVSLAWITGALSAGQSFSPALSWIPTEAGTYTATAFVWESVDNPTALSPPVSTEIIVK